ncbi:hypothetical protein [Ferrimonas balearica]|uniref:hypothetical protein n=1 Tax=Ferrimonas balearica TaxID=44012 RepID=UPI001C99106D|nr:hypothetical protein [Ferrimonas balearica]MBY5992550.1 hypothetical protein [Ferrimonas balearica]
MKHLFSLRLASGQLLAASFLFFTSLSWAAFDASWVGGSRTNWQTVQTNGAWFTQRVGVNDSCRQVLSEGGPDSFGRAFAFSLERPCAAPQGEAHWNLIISPYFYSAKRELEFVLLLDDVEYVLTAHLAAGKWHMVLDNTEVLTALKQSHNVSYYPMGRHAQLRQRVNPMGLKGLLDAQSLSLAGI